MPRPQPVFIPGGMGSNFTSQESSGSIDLGAILNLYDRLIKAPQREKASKESATAVAQYLGLDKQRGGEAMDTGGGLVNAPSAPGMDVSSVVGSPEGRKTLIQMLAGINKPMTMDQVMASLFKQGNVAGANQAGNVKQGLEGKKELLQMKGTAIKSDHYTIQSRTDPADIKSIRLESGQTIPEGYKLVGGTGAEGQEFDPATIKALAERFGASGEIPGMGMGKAATIARTQVLNQWAKDLKTTGTTPQEQLAKQASYKASTAELKTLKSQRGKVMAFAKTADLNLDLAAKMVDDVADTSIPIINGALRRGDAKIAGDEATANFYAALRTGINEYAKVTSSATGGGVTSDAARKEVLDMLDDAYTKGQFKSVVKNVLKVDLNNRKTGYDEQIFSIEDSISNANLGKPSNPSSKKIGRFTVEVQ